MAVTVIYFSIYSLKALNAILIFDTDSFFLSFFSCFLCSCDGELFVKLFKFFFKARSHQKVKQLNSSAHPGEVFGSLSLLTTRRASWRATISGELTTVTLVSREHC